MGIIVKAGAVVEAKAVEIAIQDVVQAVKADARMWERNSGIVEIGRGMFTYRQARRVLEGGRAVSLLVVNVK